MSSNRILVVGCNGLLGQKVTELLVRGSAYSVGLASLAPKPHRVLPQTEYFQLDITSRKDVKTIVTQFDPDVVVNAAAMTNVDACERDRELAWKINVAGVEHLIEAAKKRDAQIVHISTDYVFDGKSGPYLEDDRPEPLSYYGKTKLASENAMRSSGLPFVLLRTIVLYGYAPGAKPNFALWLIDNLEKKLPVRIVDDQFGNPTLADDLAYAIVSAIDLGRNGTYHVAGRDVVSRYQFALTLAKVFEFDASLITPIKTSQLKQPATRPLRSGLVTLKAEVELGLHPSSVEEGLRILKTQMQRTHRRIGDSPPIKSATATRQSKRSG